MHMTHSARPLVSLSLALLLAVSPFALTACNGSNTPGTDTGVESTADSTTAPVDHTITILNADGSPVSDVIVKIMQGEEQLGMKVVGPTGAAKFSLIPGDYRIVIATPSGDVLSYDEAAAVLTPTTTDVSVTVYSTALETVEIMAPGRDGEHRKYEAAVIGDGTTHLEYTSGDYTYIIYVPSQEGIFAFSCTDCASFTYHGMPLMVLNNPVYESADGQMEIQVLPGSIGEQSTSSYVFRIMPKNEADENFTFTVTRKGDIPKDETDVPWVVPTAGADLKAYEGDTSGTLTDLDITDPSLTVVIGEDGYYHYGTADGPVVFLRISSDSPYIEDFVKMCETDRIRAYFYKEDGSFDYKESYNGLINEYAAVANEDGVVPLNAQLAHMVQNAGRHMGWWSYDNNMDIFGDLYVPEERAWLFACAYYKK